MGAGRLRWWSSAESRSGLNSRLHEQWQKEQGEKGFLPESERWPTILADDLFFLSKDSRPMRIGSANAVPWTFTSNTLASAPIIKNGNLTIVSCRHIPPHTGYIFPGEFNCALCAKEKAMENEVDVDTVQMGWACGQVRVRRVPTLGEYEFLLVAGTQSGDYCFPGTLHPGEDLVRELGDTVVIRDAQGFAPKKIDLNAKSFEQLKAIVKSTMRYSTLSPHPPSAPGSMAEREELLSDRALLNELTWMLSKEVDGAKDTGAADTLNRLLFERRELIEKKEKSKGGQVVGTRFLEAMFRLMGEEGKGIFTDERLEDRVDELLDLESIFDRDSILVDESKLSPEEIRRLRNDHHAQHIKAIAPVGDGDHDKHVAAHLAAIINAPPTATGRLAVAEQLVTFAAPSGDKITMHFPKEMDMATSSKMTIEEYRKEYGEPKHVGEDVFCKCCGKKAERTFGPAPYECRMGLRPNIEGWMKVFFPIRTTSEGVMQESFDVCTSCAKKVSDYIVYVGKEKSGETGLSDEDLLADDA